MSDTTLPANYIPKNDLERGIKALIDKKDQFALYFQYYDGDHPTVYVANRLREVFDGIDAEFNLNWCQLVIDAVANRLSLKGFQAPDYPDLKSTMDDVYKQTGMFLESEDAHDAAMITGESFIIAWQNPETMELDVYYNDPRMVHVFYDPMRPKIKQFAVKWYTERQHIHVVLYYPDRLEKYVSAKSYKPGSAVPYRSDQFARDIEGEEWEVNPFGEVPVFHFRVSKRTIKSDLKSVIAPQDATNKLLMDMLIAAEFAAFKQKWVISNADLTDLKNSPGTIMELPAGDTVGQNTQVGEFSETDLKNYLSTIDSLAEAISAITLVPKHFFFRDTQAPSGEALLALEAPLVGKIQNRIDHFTPTWRELMYFLLRLRAGDVLGDVEMSDIEPIFADPETVQPLTQAQVRQTNVQAGLPLEVQLSDEGKDQDYIDKVVSTTQAAEKRSQENMQNALSQALMNQNRGDNADQLPQE